MIPNKRAKQRKFSPLSWQRICQEVNVCFTSIGVEVRPVSWNKLDLVLVHSCNAIIEHISQSSLPGWLPIQTKPLGWGSISFLISIQWYRVASHVWWPARFDHVVDLTQKLWRTWVEVVAEPSSVRGRGFCVVWWNGDGRAVGQLITARRCFPLSRVWRQRRGVS